MPDFMILGISWARQGKARQGTTTTTTTTTTTIIINIMGGPFPSAKGSNQLSALPPTFVGGIFHNTKEFSLPQSSRPLTSAILHFMELMAYRATPKKWHRPKWYVPPQNTYHLGRRP